jgi:multisubunit Na+/H+ antiporter MnhE subunit
MRRLQFWWYGILFVSRFNPPQVVAAAMLLLAMMLCIVWWVTQGWPYLALCLSYILGAIAAILASEMVAPSPQTHQVRLTAVVALFVLLSAVGFYLAQAVHLA